MNYTKDERIILTLDAGGTNFVFSAIQSCNEIISPINKPIKGLNLHQILTLIIDGFVLVNEKVYKKADAISFSFPGPADYKNGIIGKLENLPAFEGGIALQPMLENKFKLPVFINNDGDLFTFGEAIAGFLPKINSSLKKHGTIKKYANLLGITLGTGFGAGIVTNNQMMLGDNSAGAEINRMRNKLYPATNAEDSLTIRAIKRVYNRETTFSNEKSLEPKGIFDIATGNKKGDKKAALIAFEELAIVAGDTLANASSLIDGLIVIGGGLAGAHPVFLQKLVNEMNSKFKTLEDEDLQRMEVKAFNLESKIGFNDFIKDTSIEISVPLSDQKVKYDPIKKIGVGISKLGTSKATSIGAYVFALKQLDKIKV